MSDKTTIVFLGSPDFACSFLDKLSRDSRFEVLAAITQEDKPSGRKKILTPTPVKKLALSLGIPVFQPPRLNKDLELIEHLRVLNPDFLLVVAYGQIVSQKVLDLPKIKAINVHGSLLPAYRGASPIEQSLLNGDSETGLSIMEMVLMMDAGPVFTTIRQQILPTDNDLTLRQKLSEKGSSALPDILMQIKTGQLQGQPQDQSKVTFCQKINKTDGLIDPLTQTARQIFNRYRAFILWPGIFLNFQGKQLKLLSLQPAADNLPAPSPGKFHSIENRLYLGCLEGTLEILSLQLEGKTAQNTEIFLRGNRHLFD